MGAIRPPYVKVICPTAPTMPVTLNSGFRMPSWFDLKTLDESGPEDEQGTRLNPCFISFDFSYGFIHFSQLVKGDKLYKFMLQ